jgi:hypothetical protein
MAPYLKPGLSYYLFLWRSADRLEYVLIYTPSNYEILLGFIAVKTFS